MNADLELRRHLIEHRLHDRGHACHHDYIADPEARCTRHHRQQAGIVAVVAVNDVLAQVPEDPANPAPVRGGPHGG
jgi:hypothetical protein